MLDFEITKPRGELNTEILEKAEATVIRPGRMVTLSSGLAIEAVGGSAKYAYSQAGAPAGVTEVSVIGDPSIEFRGNADAVFAESNRGAEVDLIIDPASLLTGVTPKTLATEWVGITDGSLRITIDGTTYNIDAIDFTGDTTMALVAATLQTAVQAATSGSETVTYDSTTERFTINSVAATVASEVSVLSTSTGTVGTDISGALFLNGTITGGLEVLNRQVLDLGASTTDVNKIAPGVNAGEVGSLEGIRFKINKPLY